MNPPARDPIAELSQERARREVRRAYAWAFAGASFLAAVSGAAAITEFDLGQLWAGLPRTVAFFAEAAPDLKAEALFAGEKTQGSLAFWFYAADDWVLGIWQSLEIALLATILGLCGALALAFLAAEPTTPHPAARFLARRVLQVFRSIPDVVLALIFVFAFGIGPPAGVIAIAIQTTGALGKLFAEVIDAIDRGPLEGVRAAGGGRFDEIRFGALPQALPGFVSYGLLRFEINVASASVIGLVGAGGIGAEFIQAINFGAFEDALAIMVLVVGLIVLIDLTSEAVRTRLSARRG